MKIRRPRLADGAPPLGARLTNEIDRNRHQKPKTYVPFKDRPKMGMGEPKLHVNLGGAARRKVKVTLSKLGFGDERPA
jgi:hypothetical protein